MAVSTVKLNGTTLMTVNDTTATAATVQTGSDFYGADGVKTAGTAWTGEQWDDFSGGNIKALVTHGTEYIICTGFVDPLNNLYAFKCLDTSANGWEGYWIQRSGTKFNCLERNSTNWNMYIAIHGTALSGVQFTNYSSSATEPFVAVISALGAVAQPTTGNVKDFTLLGIMKNDGTVGNPATCEFYGMNILNSAGQYTKRFRPWLENGVPCVKDLESGTIWYNSGTGGFDYIDLEGVLHSV